MPPKLKTFTGFAFWVLALTLTAAGPAAGQGPAPAEKGFFFSFSGQSLNMRGDLDGQLVLWHFEKAFSTPRLESGFGLGLGFGYRSEQGLWEFAYVHASPKMDLNGTPGMASYSSLEINGWAIPWKNIPIQPYFLLGLCFPWLTVPDGARMGGSVYDATYTGAGVNIGGGLLLNLGKRLFLSGGIKYRYLGFFYVNGGGKGRDITYLSVGYQGPRWAKWLMAPSLGLSFHLGLRL